MQGKGGLVSLGGEEERECERDGGRGEAGRGEREGGRGGRGWRERREGGREGEERASEGTR